MASQTDLLNEFDPLGSSAVTATPLSEKTAHHSTGKSFDLKEGSCEHKQEEPGTDPPHVGVALPHDVGVVASQATISLSDADVSILEGLTKGGGVTVPHEGVTVPHEGVAVPHEGITVPHEGVAVPHEGVTAPHEGVTAPHEGVTVPQGGVTVPSEGFVPQEGVGVSQSGATVAQSVVASTPEHPAPSNTSTSIEKKRKSHKHKKRSLREKDKTVPSLDSVPPKPAAPVAMVPQAPVPDVNLAQTQLEMMQIDSILQALSSGSIDLAAISKLTAQPAVAPPRPVVPSKVAGTSMGLQLINQIQSGSGEESSSSESDSEESSEEDDDDIMPAAIVDDEDEDEVKGQGRKYGYPTVKGEVDYRDLPPVEKRVISFPEGAELAPIGRVSHITEKLVVIQALPGASPVNEGTAVWSHEKEFLGEIFETFGPVKSPFYSLLVNSESPQELSPSLAPDQVIYIVPNNQSLTSYVFTSELMKQKGCDASWKGDIEVPADLQEHSDDEAEVKSKKRDREDKPRKKDDKKDRLQKTSSVVYSSDPMMKAYFQGPPAMPPTMGPSAVPYQGYPSPQGFPQYPAYPPHQSSLGYSQSYAGGPTPYYQGGPYYPPAHGMAPYSIPQRPANYPVPQGPPHYQAPPHGYQGPPRGYQPQW